MKVYTMQEAFDVAAKHLLTQKEKSLLSDGKCAYRGEGYKMCAVGVLIPDDVYKPEIEDLIPKTLSRKYEWFNELFPFEKSVRFLGDLQDVHDSNEPYGWADKLEELAELYNLEPNNLEI